MSALRTAFRDQAVACRNLGSPFMGHLMDLLAARLTEADGPVAQRLLTWPGDVSAAGQSLPLRLAGGLHALCLRGDANLAAVYPPQQATEDALWAALARTLRDEASFLSAWIARPPQTNELGRAGPIRAAAHWAGAWAGLPLEVWELGASAGLNLNWDRFHLDLNGTPYGPKEATVRLHPDWTGPLPPADAPQILAKAGVDLTPLDPLDAEDQLRLLAYLWPDQPTRLARMKAALALPQTAIETSSAADWLEARLRAPRPPGQALFLYHTVAWQYFPTETQDRITTALHRLGADATPETPLIWFAYEADGAGPGAGLTLRLWPGNETLTAGRADFHGRWIRWELPSPNL